MVPFPRLLMKAPTHASFFNQSGCDNAPFQLLLRSAGDPWPFLSMLVPGKARVAEWGAFKARLFHIRGFPLFVRLSISRG